MLLLLLFSLLTGETLLKSIGFNLRLYSLIDSFAAYAWRRDYDEPSPPELVRLAVPLDL